MPQYRRRAFAACPTRRSGIVELFALMLTLPGLIVAFLILAVLVARLFMRGAAYPGSLVLVKNSMEADCSRDLAKEVFSAAVHAEAALAEAGVAPSCRAATASLSRAGFGTASPPTTVSSGRCPPSAAAATLGHIQTVLSAQLAMSDAVRDTDVGRRSAVGVPAEALAGETSTPFARRMLHELALAIAGLSAISSESRRLSSIDGSLEWTDALTMPLCPESASAGIAAVCPRPRPSATILAVTEEPEPGAAAAAAAADNEKVLAAGSFTPHARLGFLELRAGQGALERSTVAAINQLLTGSTAVPGAGGSASAAAASGPAVAPTVFDVIAATSSRLRSLQQASVWMSKVPTRRRVRRGDGACRRRCGDILCGLDCGCLNGALCADFLGCPGPTLASGCTWACGWPRRGARPSDGDSTGWIACCCGCCASEDSLVVASAGARQGGRPARGTDRGFAALGAADAQPDSQKRTATAEASSGLLSANDADDQLSSDVPGSPLVLSGSGPGEEGLPVDSSARALSPAFEAAARGHDGASGAGGAAGARSGSPDDAADTSDRHGHAFAGLSPFVVLPTGADDSGSDDDEQRSVAIGGARGGDARSEPGAAWRKGRRGERRLQQSYAVLHHTRHGLDLAADCHSQSGGRASGGGRGGRAWGSVAVVDLEPAEGVGAYGRRPLAQGTHMADLPDHSADGDATSSAGPAPGLGSSLDDWEDKEDTAAAKELLASMGCERPVQESRRRLAAAQGAAGNEAGARGGSGGARRASLTADGPPVPGSAQSTARSGGPGGEAGRTADNEAEGGGGIISTITALPGMSLRMMTQLANAWARRNAPGPVGGFGFQRVEMLLAHDGWSVTLDQEDGAFVDAAVLPFRRSTPAPDLSRWVGKGARQAAEQEGARAAEQPSAAGAAAGAAHMDEAPAEPLSSLGLLPAAWGGMLPAIAGAGRARCAPSHEPSRGSAASCPGPARGSAPPSTPPRSASFGSAHKLAGAATGLGRPLMGSQQRSSRRRAAAAASGGARSGTRTTGLAASSPSSHSLAHLHRQDIGDRPVVICSNPNGGLYELWHRWSESLELYLSNGFTVIVFNYRGYGRSTGSPSPGRCTSDAEALVRYARRHLGARRVLAHSESIGGIVSSRLAASGAVDGLIGDRNFDNLALTASMLMGQWAEVGMHMLSRWAARSNADAILEATCPKIILANPTGDEVIGIAASASVGVANRVADAWAEAAGPLPSPPAGPLPIDPSASSCAPGCSTGCAGKGTTVSPNDSLASVSRRFQLALARATMACAHNLAPAEALQACAAAQDVRFPGASIRCSGAPADALAETEPRAVLVALEPEELSLRRLAVAAEDDARRGPASGSVAGSRGAGPATTGPRRPGYAVSAAAAGSPAPGPSSDNDDEASIRHRSQGSGTSAQPRSLAASIAEDGALSDAAGDSRPPPTPARAGAASAGSDHAPASAVAEPAASSAETHVQCLSPVNASLPLFLSPRLPPTYVDADLVAACFPSLQQAQGIVLDRLCAPSAMDAVRTKVADALAAAGAVAADGTGGAGGAASMAAAAPSLDADLLRETAFPGITNSVDAVIRAVRGDVPAAMIAALSSAMTAAGPMLALLQSDLLAHSEAAPGFFALHAVYSMAWAVESGADAADTTVTGEVPLWARPASQQARLACGLPPRPDSVWASQAVLAGAPALLAAPADPGAVFPDGPSLSTRGAVPPASLAGVVALPSRLVLTSDGGATVPGSRSVSLHAAVAIASTIAERMHPQAVERGDPGAKEAMLALCAARRLIEIAEWIALRGGPRAQLDAALAHGTLAREGLATVWKLLASRALRPEGVLITLGGRGHNMSWKRSHVAMVRDCGQRLGWWPTGKFVDDAEPEAPAPSPAGGPEPDDAPPADAHEILFEA